MEAEDFDAPISAFGEAMKNIVAVVAKEYNRQNGEMMKSMVEEIRQTVLAGIAQMQVEDGMGGKSHATEELIFGHFHRNDLVCKCDKRLYEGGHAPFSSKYSVQRFSAKNPTLFFKGGNGLWVARAGDIYDTLYNRTARDIASGKGIRFNNKRK